MKRLVLKLRLTMMTMDHSSSLKMFFRILLKYKDADVLVIMLRHFLCLNNDVNLPNVTKCHVFIQILLFTIT